MKLKSGFALILLSMSQVAAIDVNQVSKFFKPPVVEYELVSLDTEEIDKPIDEMDVYLSIIQQDKYGHLIEVKNPDPPKIFKFGDGEDSGLHGSPPDIVKPLDVSDKANPENQHYNWPPPPPKPVEEPPTPKKNVSEPEKNETIPEQPHPKNLTKSKFDLKERKNRLHGPSGTAGVWPAQKGPKCEFQCQYWHCGDPKVYTSNLVNKGMLLTKMTIGTTDHPNNNSVAMLVDTGSSWTWVKSCDPSRSSYWKENACPYFRQNDSASLTPTSEEQSIEYGGGWMTVSGPVYEEFLQPQCAAPGELRAKMPIILNHVPRVTYSQAYGGILGLSPDDDSAGPLFMNYLYDQEKIRDKKFSILPALSQWSEGKLTYGDYQRATVEKRHQKMYDPSINNITSHRISGSFHWELPIINVGIRGRNTSYHWRPQVNNALLDTGSSVIMMPQTDYDIWIRELCHAIDVRFADREGKKVKCNTNVWGFTTISNCDKESIYDMPAFDIQIDQYNYTVRSNTFMKINQHGEPWVVIDSDTEGYDGNSEFSFYCTLRVFPSPKQQWILGTPFLNDYYQVYDVRRNQIGLVPHISVNFDAVKLNQIPTEPQQETLRFHLITWTLFGLLILTLVSRNTCIQNNRGIHEDFYRYSRDSYEKDLAEFLQIQKEDSEKNSENSEDD